MGSELLWEWECALNKLQDWEWELNGKWGYVWNNK